MSTTELLSELRAMGVRFFQRAGTTDVPNTVVMRGTTEWSPEFSARVAAVLARHGYKEAAEGLWSAGDMDAEALRRWEELARGDAEAEHRRATGEDE